MKVTTVHARQVLDSRDNYTLGVTLSSGLVRGTAMVPSGASTGKYEALELRDPDGSVRTAVKHVNTIIARRVKGFSGTQRALDERLIALDGTPNKSRLGANALLGVSLAYARFDAHAHKKPLFASLGSHPRLPVPYANVINGGKHAIGGLSIQEFMVVPKARSFVQATEAVSACYHALRQLVQKKYGSTSVGDEGGFVPPLKKTEDALHLIEKAIERSGYSLRIALDCAASEFYRNRLYHLHGKAYTSDKLIDYYLDLTDDYDICSIEDPFDQDDFESWKEFMQYAGIQVVADDLTVTNIDRLHLAVKQKLANCLLLKVNQIGTLTEAMDAAHYASRKNWGVMVSHRSGETEDPFIADLSVALGCGMIKLGAPSRSERTAKYNRLLAIEEVLGKKAKYG